MKLGFWNYYSSLNSSLFVERNAPLGDDLLLPFMRVRELAAQRGIECVVLSAENVEDLDAAVFIDYPDTRDPIVRAAFDEALHLSRYLITFEPPTVRWENYAPSVLFTKVFTWDDTRVGTRYVKLNYASEFPDALPLRGTARKPLCMMASAKHSAHPASLYHRRREVAEFFAQFTPEGYPFDLYGHGWNGNPRWCGTVPPGQKRNTLACYRYAVVHENGRFPGYITEKLFDCFIAGTVPIYLGAPNVASYIPPECYVDMAQFGETWTRVGRMWEWIKRQTAADYDRRRAAIEAFIKSPRVLPFTTKCFAETIVNTIDGDLTTV